ncbi:MAG: histidine phosphatase family protein [Clostridia bacterium]|nr:histidine phosphatase family protein [Clostridia bacterium]
MLYIMRHGETDWNRRHKLQGRIDIPLNDEGRRMAAQAGEAYKDLHWDVCYCSPLARARETAALFLANRNIPIVTDDRLAEMSFGLYEGAEDYADRADCPIRPLFVAPETYTASIGGAETFASLFGRIQSFLTEIVEPQLQEGKDLLIVGHGAWNAAFACHVRGLPLSQFWSLGTAQCQPTRLL